MTRHQRNCTAGTVYTYHERKKDTETSGYGTKQSRLGKDSTRNFDCCCLTLQPCKNPVITPDGWLYDKEAILEYILHQKQAIARQMKEYERQKKQLESEELAKNSEAKVKNLKRFAATEQSITSKPINPFTNGPPAKKQKTATVTSATATAAEPKPGPSRETNGETSDAKNGKELPSFWIPSLTPDAKPTLIKKPGKHVFCPMSKKQLKVKALIDIEFVAVNDADDKRHLLNKDARYMCAVTRDTLSNSTPVAILKTSRKVITVECIEKLIKKDMIDPISGEKITEADIIKLQRGGTGFASTGVDLEAKKHRPVMMAS